MRVINKFLKKTTINESFTKSYSQEGEDLILNRFFEYQSTGFYIDVGAFDPIKFSNTYLFYKKGWRGINIDATPGSMDRFNIVRPLDINLEFAISDKRELVPLHIFNEPALNTLSINEAKKSGNSRNYQIIKTETVETRTLIEILDRFLPQSMSIDFINIDVEGYDLKVLHSNDWVKYRPKCILVEEINTSCYPDWSKSDIYCFLNSQGFELRAKSFYTYFYFDITKN